MSRDLTKIIITTLVGLVSLSTTAVAGYKVYKNNTVKAEKEVSSNLQATPETNEVIEEVEEIEIMPNQNKTISATTMPLSTTIPNATGLIIPTATTKPTPVLFTDDEDDEVEFENADENDNDSESDTTREENNDDDNETEDR